MKSIVLLSVLIFEFSSFRYSQLSVERKVRTEQTVVSSAVFAEKAGTCANKPGIILCYVRLRRNTHRRKVGFDSFLSRAGLGKMGKDKEQTFRVPTTRRLL